jgi:hypothetical protein
MGASGESRSRDSEIPRIVLILRRVGLLDAQSRTTHRATQLADTARRLLRHKKQDGYESQEFVHELGAELFKDDTLLAECPEGDPEQFVWLRRKSRISSSARFARDTLTEGTLKLQIASSRLPRIRSPRSKF